MSLFDWFAETRSRASETYRRKTPSLNQNSQEREIPDGLWHKCSSCGALTYVKDLKTNFKPFSGTKKARSPLKTGFTSYQINSTKNAPQSEFTGR